MLYSIGLFLFSYHRERKIEPFYIKKDPWYFPRAFLNEAVD